MKTGTEGFMEGQSGGGGTGAEGKGETLLREKEHYVNSGLVHPCNPSRFHVALPGYWLG